MAAQKDKACTLVIHHEKSDAGINQLKEQLENGDTAAKIAALKETILLMLNGQRLPQLLMTIIRFIMPCKDKTIKKLLLVYWEICDKTDENGKLLHEMILVCSHFRNDLNHPNEYVRGMTLRFLCKLKEPELLEPLLPAVRLNLEHRHSYVRRNAVLAIFSIYKHSDHLIPDAPELIFNFLQNEGDASCKRNAFIMLFNCAQEKAVEYLGSVLNQVNNFGDILQFTIVELIRKVCRTNPAERAKYLKCLFELLKTSSAAVRFEAASALIALTTAPTAIKAAASAFIKILCEESDNNVKMIVLDKLDWIRQHHNKVMRALVMDVLRALASPNMDIKKKTLDIALDLVTPANIDEVIQNLKKEIIKTQTQGFEKAGEYRQMLIRAIHSCAVKYPAVASSVVHVLMDFLGDSNVPSAVEVVTFVREVVETYPDLRQDILRKLLKSLKHINSSTVYRAVLWIVGEYSTSTADIDVAFVTLQEELGELPLIHEPNKKKTRKKKRRANNATNLEDGEDDDDDDDDDEADEENGDAEEDEEADANGYESGRRGGRGSGATKPYKPTNAVGALLPDGTYATQTALSVAASSSSSSLAAVNGSKQESGGSLRALLMTGDFFLGSVLATTLTKMALRSFTADTLDDQQKNSFAVEVLLILVSILRLGKSTQPRAPMDEDSEMTITLCIKTLADPAVRNDERRFALVRDVFLQRCRQSLSAMLREQQKEDAEEKKKLKEEVAVQPDDLLVIKQLRARRGFGMEDLDQLDDELLQVTGFSASSGKGDLLQLNRLHQLTGLSDPVYAEAYVQVHQYDIVLDVLVVNQTPDTLQNLTLELATMGDLKLCERPRNYNVGPFGQVRIQADIKVSSTENGVIFGNIVYNIAGQASTFSNDANVVILNDIHIDIMDYIHPATCTNLEFRTMWSEFEWENKIVVNTEIPDVNEYLEHILKSTNMKCLTPKKALEGDCGFISANLYARSTFGEDALANLSVEKKPDGKVEGFIRIRSKTQGIALSLGDKITSVQKTNKKEEHQMLQLTPN